MFPRSLLLALLVLGSALTASVVPGPFSIDENNYLVTVVGLMQGRLTVPGTEGLPPSRELLYFDPAGLSRQVLETPVVSNVPPLYSFIAAPFSLLGWRGLVALNTLCFLATVLLVFAYARRHSSGPMTPWIAAFAFALGSYSLEYAQGVWPHMLTVFLCSAAVVAASRAWHEQQLRWALVAGISVGIATGVRYQNILFAAALGLGLVLLAPRRFRLASAYGFGLAIPLAMSSVLNGLRMGYWNPISKGPGYLPSTRTLSSGDALTDAVKMAWARVVDYSFRPPMTGSAVESFLQPDPTTGAYIVVGAVKKAWLQSSPWMVLPLLLVLLAWLPPSGFRKVLGATPQQELRLLSIPVVLTLLMFSTSGIYRTDGFCFNQRYFHELVPLMAVSLAWAADGVSLRREWILGGALLGALAAIPALVLLEADSAVAQLVLLRAPLALALLLAVAWLVARARRSTALAMSLVLGATLAWALMVHLADDLPASRSLRRSRYEYQKLLGPFLVDGSAVFARSGIKDALGPLQLQRDIVILNPALDEAVAMRETIDALLDGGRRVFLARNALPTEALEGTLAGLAVRYLGEPIVFLEVAKDKRLSLPAPPASAG